jgi:predicted nuclease of predicted toxin-antitoxin system
VAVDFPPGSSDKDVLLYAHKEQRILITNDKGDFGELIFRSLHPHAGVILFRRIGFGDLALKQKRLAFVLQAYASKLHHFLIVTPKTVRIRQTPVRPYNSKMSEL